MVLLCLLCVTFSKSFAYGHLEATAKASGSAPRSRASCSSSGAPGDARCQRPRPRLHSCNTADNCSWRCFCGRRRQGKRNFLWRISVEKQWKTRWKEDETQRKIHRIWCMWQIVTIDPMEYSKWDPTDPTAHRTILPPRFKFHKTGWTVWEELRRHGGHRCFNTTVTCVSAVHLLPKLLMSFKCLGSLLSHIIEMVSGVQHSTTAMQGAPPREQVRGCWHKSAESTCIDSESLSIWNRLGAYKSYKIKICQILSKTFKYCQKLVKYLPPEKRHAKPFASRVESASRSGDARGQSWTALAMRSSSRNSQASGDVISRVCNLWFTEDSEKFPVNLPVSQNWVLFHLVSSCFTSSKCIQILYLPVLSQRVWPSSLWGSSTPRLHKPPGLLWSFARKCSTSFNTTLFLHVFFSRELSATDSSARDSMGAPCFPGSFGLTRRWLWTIQNPNQSLERGNTYKLSWQQQDCRDCWDCLGVFMNCFLHLHARLCESCTRCCLVHHVYVLSIPVRCLGCMQKCEELREPGSHCNRLHIDGRWPTSAKRSPKSSNNNLCIL